MNTNSIRISDSNHDQFNIQQKRNKSKSVNLFFLAPLVALICPGLATATPSETAKTRMPVEITGELEVLNIDDFEHNNGKILYFVNDKRQGKRFQIDFRGAPPKNAATGNFVRIRGQKENGQILIAANNPSSIETLATATAAVSGEQKTIVLVANFNDASVPCSTQEIEDTMFTDPNYQSVNDLYRETSLDNIQFTGSVAGPFTINYGSSSCDVYGWAAAADAQAQASGIDLTQYGRKVYVMPKENGCGYTGIGTVGGNPSQSWNFRCELPDVYAHELGHALGMHHASAPMGEYWDLSDIMGFSGVGLRQINGPHQEQMGWREPQQIVEINADGIYEISPLELDSATSIAPQLLKIRKQDTDEWYYLSYRQPDGFDTSLDYSYLDGLSIHRYLGDGSSSQTHWISTLTDSGSFSDPINGVTVTQLSHNASAVTLEVTLPDICIQNIPTVDITPQSHTGEAGSTFNYNLTLINNDSASCADSTWTLSSFVPADWSDTLTAASVTVAPGESVTIDWSVTSAISAADNDYMLSVDLSDTNLITHDSSVVVNYTVSTPADTQAPTEPTQLTASEQRKSITLSWQAATDNNVVAGYEIYRNNVKVATSSSTSYKDSALTSGATYTYYVVAFDPANNTSLQSNTSTVAYGTTSNNKGGGGKKR